VRGSRRWLPLAVTSGGLLAWSNAVLPALPPATGVRALANLGATVGLVLAARSAGLTWVELGMSRSTWRAGARWGGAALAAAAAGYLVALAIPAGRTAVAGFAPGGLTAGELVTRALVLIPLGVVVCEEVAFRGVLLAVARRQLPVRSASAVTAVVFGAWHVSTALGDSRSTASPVLAAASVAGIVVLTGLGGVVLAWLRLRSGSLLAPIGLHLGTNSVGLLAAAAAAR
jgi:uncharacterized protein